MSHNIWTPCAMLVLRSLDVYELMDDPYLYALISIFLKTNIICSDNMCQSTTFCSFMWTALDLSNFIKQKPELSGYYLNKHIHHVNIYEEDLHIIQHNSTSN